MSEALPIITLWAGLFIGFCIATLASAPKKSPLFGVVEPVSVIASLILISGTAYFIVSEREDEKDSFASECLSHQGAVYFDRTTGTDVCLQGAEIIEITQQEAE